LTIIIDFKRLNEPIFNLKRAILHTHDGSTTIHIEEWDECYHSKFGAIQEAQHVFIKNGLSLFKDQSISILEIGFGTGLNAFITFLESKKLGLQVDYVGIEAYPITQSEIKEMNYVSELKAESDEAVFETMHSCPWEEKINLKINFYLTKKKQFFHEIEYVEQFNLIYFDAFGYRVQPELWTFEIFKLMFKALKKNGVLVTYAARSIIKKNMQEAGFTVEKLQGPPGKREMFRATK
jgi:tRNA U34 5-methylaminomethyl-2-thiouridine-forming methyltransferase MnmC